MCVCASDKGPEERPPLVRVREEKANDRREMRESGWQE